MIQKPFGIQRPRGKAPRPLLPAPLGWYKRFRQLAAQAGKQLKVKS